MPVFKIHHLTRYEYDRPVKESVNQARVFPYRCKEQEVLDHEIFITDHPPVNTFTDYWGNEVGTFNLLSSHINMMIESKLTIRTLALPSSPTEISTGFAELQNDIRDNLNLLELSMMDEVKLKDQFNEIIAPGLTNNHSIAAIVENCSAGIFNGFSYIKGITNVETTVAEILEHRSGVCQDFAHVLLEMLRHLGIPGRYVSGYICPNKTGMRGEGATHAWVEAWIPGYGWAGIDPTNNTWVNGYHVKLAVGRNFNDCSPVKGSFKGPARQSLSVYVSIGYEDGHTFEDITNVNLQQQPAIADNVDELAQFGGQQQ